MKKNNLATKIKLRLKSVYNRLDNQRRQTLIDISRYSDKPINKPTSIIFNLTPNCVLKCKQCDIWKNPPEKHLSYEDAVIIIDKLHNWLGNCYIFFTGGEPLMNKDLPKIIGYAHSKGIKSHINSNGVLLNKESADKLIKHHLFAISLSIDGATSRTHDYLRGVPGTFSKAIRNLDYIRKQPGSPHVYINTVIMRPNVGELKEIMSLSKKHQTDGVTFQCLLPNLGPDNANARPEDNPLWPSFKEVIKSINSFKSNRYLLNSDNDLQSLRSYYQDPHSLDNLTCSAGINNFIIDHLGNVRLCFGMAPIGNILAEQPEHIWHNQHSVEQRQAIRKCRQPCKIIACNKVNLERN